MDLFIETLYIEDERINDEYYLDDFLEEKPINKYVKEKPINKYVKEKKNKNVKEKINIFYYSLFMLKNNINTFSELYF
tara:strand:+ start:97 stop:330 length:234 start_codon:yes stop_codon:yes gene_type:complete